jgi:hypothetical protein
MLLRRGITDATRQLRPSCGAARGMGRAEDRATGGEASGFLGRFSCSQPVYLPQTHRAGCLSAQLNL